MTRIPSNIEIKDIFEIELNEILIINYHVLYQSTIKEPPSISKQNKFENFRIKHNCSLATLRRSPSIKM
jgi:hypothetical protein